MHTAGWQTKLCLAGKRNLLLAACLLHSVGSVGLRLRTSPQIAPTPESLERDTQLIHSAQLIFGAVSLGILFVSFILSFVFVGNLCERVKLIRININSVQVTPCQGAKDVEPSDAAAAQVPLTAVIKMNNDNPCNFVLPILNQDEAGVANSAVQSAPACIFELEATKVQNVSFSVIIREGNIPIHFETVQANQFVKGYPIGKGEGPTVIGDAQRMLTFSTFHENEIKLKGKKVLLFYNLETK